MGANCSSDSSSSAAEVAVVAPSARKLGWRRDLPDFRDRVLALPAERMRGLPGSVDLRKGDSLAFPVYDQGALGSCTANAIGAGFHFDQLKQGIQDFAPSRLFIYYNERDLEGTTQWDNGAYIRDGIKSVHQKGVCSEALWPYKSDAQTFKLKPSEACYAAALKSRCLEYARVNQTLDEMRACLSQGLPFVFGFMVLSSFYSDAVATKGEMSMPQASDRVLGGHAVLAVGYDDERQVFIVRNSWGEGWGDRGYFYMPYAYLSDPNLASDMWVMRNVSGAALATVAMSGHASSAGAAAPAAAAAAAPATGQRLPQEGTQRREA